MSTSLMQFRVDDELKAQATAVCENLGIDLPTALRIFMKRTVIANGIPFSMTLPKEDYKSSRAVRAMYAQGEAAKKNGTADMTLEEINAEIAAARAEQDALKRDAGREG
ncbi:MAG: type II toxin-antitoxin system RelB/DinJ family antitoxin [Angelakisella sp.]|jgi:DNA-damage-inducible protein J|nr:type II toxin-antitoxin system RelB/DinJ family antitoxin [Angelakisella sp.]